MGYDEKKKFVHTFLDEDTYAALCNVSTTLGEKPWDVVEQFITDGLMQFAEKQGTGAPVDLLILAGAQKVRARDRRRALILQVASSHLADPSEETADLLASLCEAAELSLEEVVAEVQESPIVPLVQDHGKGAVSAMRWLKSVLPLGQEVPQRVIMHRAEKAGFSKSTVKYAKSQLGVRSVRKSNFWVWVREEGQEPIAVDLPRTVKSLKK